MTHTKGPVSNETYAEVGHMTWEELSLYVEALQGENTELLKVLEHIVNFRPTPDIPADTWTMIFEAIRKAKEKR